MDFFVKHNYGLLLILKSKQKQNLRAPCSVLDFVWISFGCSSSLLSPPFGR
jgi:hypothetical protein